MSGRTTIANEGGAKKVTTTTVGLKETIDVSVYDSGGSIVDFSIGGLINESCDNAVCSYDNSDNLIQILFYNNSILIATLTMTYDAGNNLITATRT